MSSYARRLPVYLLLDCSESMAGGAFAAMCDGLKKMMDELRRDPMALDLAAVSVITFASKAQQVMPLTDLTKFHLPALRMGPGTALGAALQLLEQAMKSEVRRSSPEQKGDYKPIVFILTDGEPTDNWEQAADRVRSIAGKTANVIAVGCGPDADLEKLRRITDTVLAMRSVDSVSFSEFFQWVSASMSTASRTIEGAGEEGVRLPGLPEGQLEVAKPGGQREAPVPDHYVFLHAKCVRDGSFYIMRFTKEGGKRRFLGLGKPIYRGVAAHKVEDFDFGEGPPSLSIQASSLADPPACPYCGNPLMAMCQCGRVHCCPEYEGSVTLTCPWCKATSEYRVRDFAVGRAEG